jgi:hypothetical protein
MAPHRTNVLSFEQLETRSLATGIAECAELWWKVNFLRILPFEARTKLAILENSFSWPASPPLAWNTMLGNAAQGHALDMSSQDYFSHQSQSTLRMPNQRLRDAGYPLPSTLPSDRNDVESIVAGQLLGNSDAVIRELLQNTSARNLIFPAAGTASLATEIGIGSAANIDAAFENYWAVEIAGRQTGERFITGVVYADTNNSGTFDAGEGVSQITVTSGELSTLTDSQGIYSLPVAGGIHELQFSNSAGQQLGSKMFALQSQSIQVDMNISLSKIEVNFRQRSWWTNADAHLDVNRDLAVTPIDALVIINRLNRDGGSSRLPAPNLDTPYPTFAIDVNGDSYCSPIDALVIINQLNSRS